MFGVHKPHITFFIPARRRKTKLLSAEIRPLLSLFQSAGPLLHHKLLGLMSFDLTLMTDSASVPAGRRADGSAAESHANSYLQQLREQFSFLQFSQRISTGMFSAVVRRWTKKGCSVRGEGRERMGKEEDPVGWKGAGRREEKRDIISLKEGKGS